MNTNVESQQCTYPKGCTKKTKDASTRCHLHRDGNGLDSGASAAGGKGLAGSTGNMVAQEQQQQKRAKGRPTLKLTAEEKEYYENMKIGASFRAPYFRRSINKLPVASYPGLGTFAMGKNGVVYIDFDWAMKPAETVVEGDTPEDIKRKSMEKASAILIHEASHFNLDHFNRSDMVTKNPQHAQLMNIAGDMEINQGLVNRSHQSTNVDWKRSLLKEEYNAVYPWSKSFELEADKPFEIYLRQLIKKQEEEQQKQQDQQDGDQGDQSDQGDQGDGQQQDQNGQGQDQGDGQGGDDGDQDGQGGSGMGGKPADPNGKETQGGSGSGQEDPNGHPTMCGGGSGTGTPLEEELNPTEAEGGMSEVDQENLRRDTARDIMDHEKTHGRGTVPGELVRNAEEILKGTRVDWKKEMRSAVSKSVRTVRGRKQYDTKTHNRRLANVSKYIFPGTVTPTPNISIAVDTSGSMGKTELGLALGQIQSILNQAGSKSHVDFIAVDAQSTEPSELKRLSDVELKGGGGTDMGVAIQSFDERRKNRPDLGIIVTDGGTPWPEAPPKGMDVIVAIVGQGASEDEYRGMPTPDWAKVVYINQVG